MNDDKLRLDEKGLELYTKRLKEWIFQLFRRAHARMGHIEEELVKVKKRVASKYELQQTSKSGTVTTYTLREQTTMTDHGSISIDSKGIVAQWEENDEEHPIEP